MRLLAVHPILYALHISQYNYLKDLEASREASREQINNLKSIYQSDTTNSSSQTDLVHVRRFWNDLSLVANRMAMCSCL